MLRAELGFYVGCLNLHERLAEKGEPSCFPEPVAADTRALGAHGLYDVCLALRTQAGVVGNELDADDRSLAMITGANQGGKSTFLRSVGVAQLMLQCGMFVGAYSLRAGVVDGVFTHFKREEDPTMESGKLDEELGRMSDIADAIAPNSIVLCNESFAATNEREGSEIARQVVRALLDSGIAVFLVTHLFDLANGFYQEELETALFLRAERQPDGRRTFRLVTGEPLATTYGEDSYRRVFGAAPDLVPATAADICP
jgi:DNA mismatch repair ATPase MutS